MNEYLNTVQLTPKFTKNAYNNASCPKDNSHVGLVQHEEYTVCERLLKSRKYSQVTPVVQFYTRE